MDVTILPILSDNYAYLIKSAGVVGVIDPGEASPIIDYLDSHDLTLDWVINTHHHGDHTDGNAGLLQKYRSKLAAPAECLNADEVLEHGKTFEFGDIKFDVTLTKGHTAGHIVLFDPVYRILFSGDTLFAMGCGRLFEGSADDMFKAMEYIKQLPPETAVYCGHEYTPANAKFAAHILPENIEIRKRSIEIIGQPCTMPTTIASELATNPFLIANTVEEFTKYRSAKDTY